MIIGIDGARVSGLAMISPAGDGSRPKVLMLRSIQQGKTTPERALAIMTALGGYNPAVRLIGIEKAPFHTRADVNHGSQAEIGWTQGYLVGLLHGLFWPAAGQPDLVRLVEVTPWRERMLILSTRWGVLALAPGKGRPVSTSPAMRRKIVRDGEGFRFEYQPCGHVSPISLTYSELVESQLADCGACSAHVSVPGGSTADDRRTAWKRLACELTARHWPDEYRALVEDARSRAKIVGKPDHELVGVSDACEALWIACSLLEE